jgi:tRNA acetyltransferase TAN1
MNFLITCPRHFESETIEEIRNILNELGDDKPTTIKTNFSGIIFTKTTLESEQVMKNIRDKINDEPWVMRYSLRWIPIQVETNTSIEDIRSETMKIISVMNETDSFRITVEKRDCEISSQEIIKSIAAQIKNNVSLENPDWVILVEILGPKTWISVIAPTQILSIEKEKRSVSE